MLRNDSIGESWNDDIGGSRCLHLDLGVLIPCTCRSDMRFLSVIKNIGEDRRSQQQRWISWCTKLQMGQKIFQNVLNRWRGQPAYRNVNFGRDDPSSQEKAAQWSLVQLYNGGGCFDSYSDNWQIEMPMNWHRSLVERADKQGCFWEETYHPIATANIRAQRLQAYDPFVLDDRDKQHRWGCSCIQCAHCFLSVNTIK